MNSGWGGRYKPSHIGVGEQISNGVCVWEEGGLINDLSMSILIRNPEKSNLDYKNFE